MKSSGIGGQAVMEGIMMKNKDDYAVAVRKPDGEIVVDKQTYRSIVGNHKGTGNMELVLDRKLSEKRMFPAIDIPKSGTRREDLLLSPEELEAVDHMRKALNGMRSDEAVENILNMFSRTRSNKELIQMVKKTKLI